MRVFWGESRSVATEPDHECQHDQKQTGRRNHEEQEKQNERGHLSFSVVAEDDQNEQEEKEGRDHAIAFVRAGFGAGSGVSFGDSEGTANAASSRARRA